MAFLAIIGHLYIYESLTLGGNNDMGENNSKNNFDNIEVEADSENFRGGGGLEIQQVTMRQFERCLSEGSKELTKGGIRRIFVNGIVKEIEVPNQRQIYMSAIISLELTLIPNLLKKKELVTEMKQIDSAIEKLKVDYELDYKKKSDYDNNLQKSTKDHYGNYNYVKPSAYEKLLDDHEMRLIDLFRMKLALLSRLLAAENYFSDKYA